ncbi:MAG: 2-oxoglutarate dehydrogenase complex dihydrolipoyllysine-residue succinyltransferase, partial [Steroidobacteraceae bacterium]
MYEPDPRTHHDAGDPAKPPRTSKRVPLSEAQASLTRRLRDVRAKSAVLTTFNEVDLEPLETLFARHGATFS